jgi:photoactive yellow protein
MPDVSPDERPAVLTEFSPFDLEKATRLTGGDLDALPFGVIVVDRDATILEYNAYERSLANMGTRKIIGLNFFRDVAPCAAVAEFEGRFTTFLDSHDTNIEPFQFVFPFKAGPQNVKVIFVRQADTSERAMICVLRDQH